METGEQQTVEADTVMHHIAAERPVRPPRANAYRDAWCGELAPRAWARPSASPAGCTAAATTAG